jgi:hypothetical protein
MYYIAQILYFVMVVISTIAFGIFVEILGPRNYGVLEPK